MFRSKSLVTGFAVLLRIMSAFVFAPSQASAGHGGETGVVCDIYVTYLYAAAPGGEYEIVGQYFVTVCRATGHTDWGGAGEGQQTWNDSGYFTQLSQPQYWRTTHNG
jgi:hypothetical protein